MSELRRQISSRSKANKKITALEEHLTNVGLSRRLMERSAASLSEAWDHKDSLSEAHALAELEVPP